MQVLENMRSCMAQQCGLAAMVCEMWCRAQISSLSIAVPSPRAGRGRQPAHPQGGARTCWWGFDGRCVRLTVDLSLLHPCEQCSSRGLLFDKNKKKVERLMSISAIHFVHMESIWSEINLPDRNDIDGLSILTVLLSLHACFRPSTILTCSNESPILSRSMRA